MGGEIVIKKREGSEPVICLFWLCQGQMAIGPRKEVLNDAHEKN